MMIHDEVQHPAFDEDHIRVPTEEFDFDAVSKNLGEVEELPTPTDAFTMALDALDPLLSWLASGAEGTAKNKLAALRYLISAKNHSLEEIAKQAGCTKQGIGKHVCCLRSKFPHGFARRHSKTKEACEAYRIRALRVHEAKRGGGNS